LQKVDRRSLAGEHRACQTRDFENDLVGCQSFAVAGAPVEFDIGVELAEGGFHPGAATEYCSFARDDPAPHGLSGGDELRRDVATTNVLAESCFYLGLEIGWNFKHPYSLHKRKARLRTGPFP